LNLNSYKLSSLASYYSIKQENYHNALEDAFVCGKIFANLLLEMEDAKVFLDGLNRNKIKRKHNQSETKPFQLSKESEKELVDLRDKLMQSFGIITNTLNGKSFVVSGVFESVSRTELKKLIEDNGGKVSSSISAKTSYVVAGDKMGPSKKNKAEQLKIPLLTEKEFLSLVI